MGSHGLAPQPAPRQGHETPAPRRPRRGARLAAAVLGVALGVSLTAASLLLDAPRAAAGADPGFKVSCLPKRMAPDDPIVFPGQPGRSHMHTFFATNTTASTDVGSLLAQDGSSCGAGLVLDRSAYWVPTLYQDGQPVFSEGWGPDGTVDGRRIELAVYYRRAGGAGAPLVDQAFPRGLRMIAGDMHATTPQPHVWFKCAGIGDPGRQDKLGQQIPTCDPDEELILELQFPDCWNGHDLDAADHRSHMAYSSAGVCPSGHPVKLPAMTFEVWYHRTNGPGSGFTLGGPAGSATVLSPYGLHGDVISAWDPALFAAMVNQCVNVDRDCSLLTVNDLDLSDYTQAQVDAQLRPGAAAGGGTGGTTATPAAAPQAAAPPAAGGTAPAAPPAPAHEHAATPAPSAPPTTSPSAASSSPSSPPSPSQSPSPTTLPSATASPSPVSPHAAHAAAGQALLTSAAPDPAAERRLRAWVWVVGIAIVGAAGTAVVRRLRKG